jgi:hypothetical protein
MEVKIYYLTGVARRDIYFAGKEKHIFKDENYVLVSKFEEKENNFSSVNHLLEELFRIFNWVDEKTPKDPRFNFDNSKAEHSSMSVGDVIEIDRVKYFCDSFDWKQIS